MKLKAQHSPDLLVRLSATPPIIERITGERPHKSAIYRWVQRGLRGVRLRTAFAGGHRRTCETWIREFFAAVTAAADGGGDDVVAVVAPTRPARRNRNAEIARADAELSRDGI